MENRVLIVGIDTLAGCNLALEWTDRCEVIGISRDRGFSLEGCRVVASGAGFEQEIVRIVAEEAPAQIVDCGAAARSSWDWTEEIDPAAEKRRGETICRVARRAGCRLTMVSTDGVFVGPRMFEREDSEGWVIRGHGIRAWVRELEAVYLEAGALVVRSHLYGWSPNGGSFAEKLNSAIEENRPVAASGSRYATPLLASDFAVLLWAAQHRRLSGFYHLGGAQRSSMYEFAKELAAAIGMQWRVCGGALGTHRGGGASDNDGNSGSHNEESSLDSRRLQREVHIAIPMLREGIERFVTQASNGHRDRISAALNRFAPAASAA
jgi:dTDP-4-dehydrorhamnose reductase